MPESASPARVGAFSLSYEETKTHGCMLLESFTATDSIRSHKWRIERDYQDLYLFRTSDVSLVRQILTGCPEEVILCIVNDNDRAFQADEIKLGYIACFSQMGEGTITESFDIATGKYKASIPLRMVRAGGIDVTSVDDATFEIQKAIVGATYEVSVMETPFSGPLYWNFRNAQSLAGSKRKIIPVADITAVLLPKTDSIRNLQLLYKGASKAVDQSLDEQQVVNAQSNDLESVQIVYNAGVFQKQAFGMSINSECIVVDCRGLEQLTINTNGDSVEFVLVQERSREYAYND